MGLWHFIGSGRCCDQRHSLLLGLAERFCNSSTTVTISASGSGADSFRWQPSALVKINGVNATTTTSSPVSVSTSGEGHLDVYAYSTGCDVASTTSKRLHTRYGPPVITERLINGIPEHWYTPYYPAEVPNGSRIAIPSSNVTSYSWTLVAGTAPLYPVIGNEHMCDISYIIDYARIEGKATNACGSSTDVLDKFLFESLSEIRKYAQSWAWMYNNVRPHSALGYRTSVEFLLKYGKLHAHNPAHEFPTLQQDSSDELNFNYLFLNVAG